MQVHFLYNQKALQAAFEQYCDPDPHSVYWVGAMPDASEVHLQELQRKLMTAVAGRTVCYCVKLPEAGRVLPQHEEQSEEMLMAGKAMAPGEKLSG